MKLRLCRTLRRCLPVLLAAVLAPLAAPVAADDLDPSVAALVATFNDEALPFNDQLIVLGSPEAKTTAVLVYGLSADAGYFMNRIFPKVKEEFVDSGKVRLVVMEFPLTWHDMQALAGLRCLPAEKHLEAMQEAVRYNNLAHHMKQSSFADAPDHFWNLLKKFDLPKETAYQCMRNQAIIGHIEGLRRTAVESWQVNTAPTLVVGDKVLANPSNYGVVSGALAAAIKD